jgi:hypothetical protein
MKDILTHNQINNLEIPRSLINKRNSLDIITASRENFSEESVEAFRQTLNRFSDLPMDRFKKIGNYQIAKSRN